MCNIAGYAGSRPAAPILLEMLRRQEYYDGNVSTGVVTIHEGVLHYRKYVGTVDALIQKSDVLELPGTIGIAHTRPTGVKTEMPRQPYISEDETAALATNGLNEIFPYPHVADAAVRRLLEKGYKMQNVSCQSFSPPRMPKSGWSIFPPEVRLKLVDLYVKEGYSYTEAMARTGSDIFADNAMVTVSEKDPDSIYALRTTRPLLSLEETGETYLATCRYAFDEGKGDQAKYLPIGYACRISRDGCHISQDRITTDTVPEITPDIFRQGCARLCEKLRVPRENAFFFDELEFAALKMRDLFPNEPAMFPQAQLVYDTLWQLDTEGRLHKELRTQEHKEYIRQRWHFWLED